MSRLLIRTASQLEPITLEALEVVRNNGELADIYLQFANSEPALRAYLHMEASVRDGSLAPAEVEAVKLWVSEQTGCEFCLAVHGVKARQAGLSRQQQVDIRTAGRIEPGSMQNTEIDGERINGLLSIARGIFNDRGSLDDQALETARTAGLTDENLVDLTMVVSTIFFTNITNHINDTRLPTA